MYKLIIVDDEQYICEGLRDLSWNKIGVEVVGLFNHGLAAQQFLSENSVDIVLTDVHMPIMNGLQLVKYIRKNCPHVKVVVLSGFDEFEYVQTSIRMGVSDYILKPINEEQLYQTISNIKDLLDSEKQQRNKIESLRQKARQKTGLLQKEYLQDILFKKLNSEKLEEICTYGEIFLESKNLTVIILRLDVYEIREKYYKESDWKLILFAFSNILRELVEDREIGYSWINNENGDSYIILTNECIQRDQHSVTKFIEDIKQNLNSIQGLIRSSISASVGKTCIDCKDIYYSREHAERQLNSISLEDSIILPQESGINLEDNNLDSTEDMSLKQEKDIDIEAGKYIIDAVKEYINKNYMKDITLTEVASHVYVNPSYLSYIFKEVVGVNFVHYLTDCRIQKATILLKDPKYKVYEVGEMVGYNNSRYFSEIFKKYIGITPYKYRNS